ncbi:pseudouridylate synthase 3 protein [Rutstroemia sp. NJR-2017a BBW]|nr:pseudouridylate synthase 3 protein [Rutstroemia sp. NJR-2017a BBW]
MFALRQHFISGRQFFLLQARRSHVRRTRGWPTKEIKSRFDARIVAERIMSNKMEEKSDYDGWSHEDLIKRVTQLEKELKAKTLSANTAPKKSWKKPRHDREFDPSKYNTRHIALKLAYLGKRYNGFEHHGGHVKPLPTIELELWKALNKARLIFPNVDPRAPGEVNWDGCDYAKCGRTDKGVSAFGQVISLRVRSNRPLPKPKTSTQDNDAAGKEDVDMYNTHPRPEGIEISSPPLSPSQHPVQGTEGAKIDLSDSELQESFDFDPIRDEIPYPQVLNRLLPPDIRILAWCPSPPSDFSARFSCRERRYRYFFTQPAFCPVPNHLETGVSASNIKDGWLDINAMRQAAKLYEGLHDFRNFCKVDPGKQITNFERRIFYANIEEVDDYTSSMDFVNGSSFADKDLDLKHGENKAPKIYSFTLHGSAFLWHQVRHMVAILFLVGQGLEKPSLVTELLDIEKNPGRPTYEMATDTPLVLWDCIFPREDDPERKDAIDWCYIGDVPGFADGKFGQAGLMDDLWQVWRERKIDSIMAGELMGIVSRQGKAPEELSNGKSTKGRSQKIFDGSDSPKLQGRYQNVMSKSRTETVEVVNERYAVRKGLVDKDQKSGFKRMKIEESGKTDEETMVE